MRTPALLLAAALLALPFVAGCEKTIREATNDRALPTAPAAVVEQPRVVPAVDGVPIA
jgi:hypothetical protein